MIRAQKALACSVLNAMSLSNPFPQGSENYGNGRGQDCKSQRQLMALRNSVFWAQQVRHTFELTDTVVIWTGCAQTQATQNSSTEERKWMPIPTHNRETIKNWFLLETRKPDLLHSWAGPRPGGLANTKRSPCIFVYFFLMMWRVLSFCCFLLYCFLEILFIYFFWERKDYKVEWVRWWGRPGRNLGRGKNMIKMCERF